MDNGISNPTFFSIVEETELKEELSLSLFLSLRGEKQRGENIGFLIGLELNPPHSLCVGIDWYILRSGVGHDMTFK
jgi:hypothetical protein